MLGIRPRGSQASKPAAGSGQDEAGRAPWKLLATFMTVSACRGLSTGLTWPFFNVLFQEELHASAAAIGFIFFCGQGVGLPSTMAAPAFSRRFGAIATILPMRLIGALCLAWMGWADNLPAATLLLVIVWGVGGVTVPAEMSFATDRVPRPYWGRMQSLRVTGFEISAALGSILAGELILRFGYGLPFALGGLSFLASAAVLVIRFGVRKHPAASE